MYRSWRTLFGNNNIRQIVNTCNLNNDLLFSYAKIWRKFIIINDSRLLTVLCGIGSFASKQIFNYILTKQQKNKICYNILTERTSIRQFKWLIWIQNFINLHNRRSSSMEHMGDDTRFHSVKKRTTLFRLLKITRFLRYIEKI